MVRKADQEEEKKKKKRGQKEPWVQLYLYRVILTIQQGDRRDLILARVSLADSLEDILWGWHKPTPSVTCR